MDKNNSKMTFGQTISELSDKSKWNEIIAQVEKEFGQLQLNDGQAAFTHQMDEKLKGLSSQERYQILKPLIKAYMFPGNPQAALQVAEYAEKSLEGSERLDSTRMCGEVYRRSGKPDLAINKYDKAIGEAQRAQEHGVLGMTYLAKSLAIDPKGKDYLTEKERLLNLAAESLDQHKKNKGLSMEEKMGRHNINEQKLNIMELRGDHLGARKVWLNMVETAKELPNKHMLASAKQGLAENLCFYSPYDYKGAEQHARAAYEIFSEEEASYKAGQYTALVPLITAMQQQGKDASEQIKKAQEVQDSFSGWENNPHKNRWETIQKKAKEREGDKTERKITSIDQIRSIKDDRSH